MYRKHLKKYFETFEVSFWTIVRDRICIHEKIECLELEKAAGN